MLDNILTWQQNGSKSTIEKFRALSPEEQQEVIDFIGEFSLYEEITVEDKQYLLVHAGLGNYAKEKDIEDYSVEELLWDRADYDIEYFDDIYTVTGHTPTQTIENNPRPGYIYRANHHIAIDCGAYIPGGRLAAICLETGEEFYAENTEE